MRPLTPVVAAAIALSIAGCATAGRQSAATVTASFPHAALSGRPSPRTAAAAAACRSASQTELASIARRVYGQLERGRNVSDAVRRVKGSAALGAAVERHSRAGTRAALTSLLKHQIRRIEVFDLERRRIAGIGNDPALAPVRGTLRDARGRVAGHYVLSASNDRNYAVIVRRITGASVSIASAGRRLVSSPAPAGGHERAYTIAATAFPSRPLRIMLLAPALPVRLCGASRAQTRMNTIGFVGRRLLRAETSSRAVVRTLRYAAHEAAFRAAVVAADPTAIRAAIVERLFNNSRYHIVRVRVQRGGRLLADVGGPYALAPASADVRGPGGRVAGRLTLSVQDDSGYIKLMRRFTGAHVLLRTRAGTVPGSNLAPGPPLVPAAGVVGYRGRSYRAFTFTAKAFPSDPLQISLLEPA